MKNNIDNGWKLKCIDNKKMKNVSQIGEGTFEKVDKCEYEGEKLHWTSLRKLAIFLKELNESHNVGFKLEPISCHKVCNIGVICNDIWGY